MTIKRIGEHVFKRNEWTEEQLEAARRVIPDFEPFDLTLMCGVDCMDYIYDLFGKDVYEWCQDQLPAQRPGLSRILETLQFVPEGQEPRTRREINTNWFGHHGDYPDSPEFIDRIFHALNSTTGKNWHERYAELVTPQVTDSKKKPAKTRSKDSPST